MPESRYQWSDDITALTGRQGQILRSYYTGCGYKAGTIRFLIAAGAGSDGAGKFAPCPRSGLSEWRGAAPMVWTRQLHADEPSPEPIEFQSTVPPRTKRDSLSRYSTSESLEEVQLPGGADYADAWRLGLEIWMFREGLDPCDSNNSRWVEKFARHMQTGIECNAPEWPSTFIVKTKDGGKSMASTLEEAVEASELRPGVRGYWAEVSAHRGTVLELVATMPIEQMGKLQVGIDGEIRIDSEPE